MTRGQSLPLVKGLQAVSLAGPLHLPLLVAALGRFRVEDAAADLLHRGRGQVCSRPCDGHAICHHIDLDRLLLIALLFQDGLREAACLPGSNCSVLSLRVPLVLQCFALVGLRCRRDRLLAML